MYRQSVYIASLFPTEVVNDFESVTQNGLFIKFIAETGYGYYTIPESAAFNPGVVVIYRSTDVGKDPLFTLYPDGRLDTLNDFYTLEYTGHDNTYISFTLRDEHFNREVAEVLYRVSDGEYLLK